MPARIGIVNGIIITVAIEVTSIYSFVIKVLCVIGRDKSTPLGIIVSCVAVVEPGLSVVRRGLPLLIPESPLFDHE